MVDVKEKMDDNGKPYYEVTSPKVNTAYKVHKSNDGFVFYKITASQGTIPVKLQGMYTTLNKAFDDLKEYLRTAKDSKTVERDRKYAANRSTKHKEPVQQGAAD